MAQAPPEAKVSWLSDILIVMIGFLIIALIYAYIFLFSNWSTDTMLRAAGITGWIFALVFYLIHASLREERTAWGMSGLFFAMGTVSLYLSVLTAVGDEGNKILWLIVISVVVIIILALAGSMAKSKALQMAREARRKVY